MSTYELLRHCAPTLANVKIGSLFSVKCPSLFLLQRSIAVKSKDLQKKGVYIQVLKVKNAMALIYVYRKKQLETLLQQEEIQSFLQGYGYESFGVEEVLQRLESQLRDQDFPHQIGVFLGYPLEDIRGFILHGGKNCYCTGVWKVYHEPERAIKTFQKYKKCVTVYLKRYAEGADMNRLTVAG